LTIRYHIHNIPYHAIPYQTIPYNTIQYNTINTMQYNTIQYYKDWSAFKHHGWIMCFWMVSKSHSTRGTHLVNHVKNPVTLTGLWLRQKKHIRGQLWHRSKYSVTINKSWWRSQNIRGDKFIFITRNRLFGSFDYICFVLFSLNDMLHFSGVILQLC
jgi:hypothetical protein